MTRLTILKALFAGIGVFALAQILYTVSGHNEFLYWILLCIPALAAFIAALLSPAVKFLTGTSIALYGGISGTLIAEAGYFPGYPIEHIGGIAETFLILFAYHITLTLAGSMAGALTSLHIQRQPRTAMP
jgi:hypothetical protein